MMFKKCGPEGQKEYGMVHVVQPLFSLQREVSGLGRIALPSLLLISDQL